MSICLLIGGDYEGIKIIGSRFSPEAHRLREFATRNGIPFHWTDVEQDEGAEGILRRFGVTAAETPIVIGRNGERLKNPSITEFARHMGFEVNAAPGEVYDLVVVGAGPAGLGAAVYAASERARSVWLRELTASGTA